MRSRRPCDYYSEQVARQTLKFAKISVFDAISGFQILNFSLNKQNVNQMHMENILLVSNTHLHERKFNKYHCPD